MSVCLASWVLVLRAVGSAAVADKDGVRFSQGVCADDEESSFLQLPLSTGQVAPVARGRSASVAKPAVTAPQDGEAQQGPWSQAWQHLSSMSRTSRRLVERFRLDVWSRRIGSERIYGESFPTESVAVGNGSSPLVGERLKHSHILMHPDYHRSPPQPGDYLTGDDGWHFFSSARTGQWFAFALFCTAAVVVDFALLRLLPSESVHKHLIHLGFWFFAAICFNVWIFRSLGEEAGIEWGAGYLLEWVLSCDNVFAFTIIFTRFAVPENQRLKAVFIGICGAVVMRMVVFMVLSTLMTLFQRIRIPCGLLLIGAGIGTACSCGGEEQDVCQTWLVRSVKRVLGARLHDGYADDGGLVMYSKEDGRLQATLLLLVVLCLEATDIIFAVDSTSAKVFQIPSQFVAFTSTILAMFGLRAMFFVVDDLVKTFSWLQYGLCAILIFIGIELIFSRWLQLPASELMVIIASVFIVCLAGPHVPWVRQCRPADEGRC